MTGRCGYQLDKKCTLATSCVGSSPGDDVGATGTAKSTHPSSPPSLPGITFQLYDRDPLGVVDQAFFDDLVGLVRAFPLLSESRRGLLVDGLASSLTCLTSWTDRALASREQDAAGTAQHRSALRAHVFFLSWLVRQWLSLREGDAASQPAALQAAKPGPRKRTVEGAAAGSEAILPTAVKAAAASLNTDLWALFRPAGPDEQLLLCYSLLVRLVTCS